MNKPILLDKFVKPTDAVLKKTLGGTFDLFRRFRDSLSAYPLEWKFYNKKSGWTLKVAGKKRAVCWVTPFDGCFMVGMVFPDSEKEAILASRVKKSVRDELASARKYPEGWPVRIVVRTESHLKTVVGLLKTIGRLE